MRFFCVALFVTLLIGCSEDKGSNVEDALFSIYQKSTNPLEKYKACLFLAELSISSQLIQELLDSKSINPSCTSYILAKPVLEPMFREQFVEDFYEGDQLTALWKMHSESGYIFGVLPPEIKLLIEIAYQNDKALDKLVASLKSADGAHNESLSDSLSHLYLKNPSRLEASFQRVGLNKESIRYIKLTSEYKRNL